jgi:hypothetical protein
MTYTVLNYMKYNSHNWYAANIAGIICVTVYCIFLNVLQFEGFNRMDICHPYFYQSSACRKLIAKTIADDPNFSSMKNSYTKKVYDTDASLVKQVQQVSSKVESQDATVSGKLSQIVDELQRMGSSYLGMLRTEASQPSDHHDASVLTQLKSLLDATVVDPAMTKYVGPLTRLYTTLSPSPAPAPL